MRALLALAALSACFIAATCDPVPAPPPHTVVRHQGPQRRAASFGGDTLQRLVSWMFPGQEKNSRAYAAATHHSPAIIRAPPKYGPPPPPPRAKFTGHLNPPQKCNPCNKVPWIPIPHAQFQDGGAVFAVVRAPQLHQGLHGGEQPSAPVYHHTPLPQGYLPGSQKPEGSVAVEEHVAAPSGPSGHSGPSGAGLQPPEIVPSIPVADYISSIEYPISVVQSPIIDVDGSKAVQHEAQETRLDLPAVGEVEHNEQPAPAAATTAAASNNHDNTPLAINSGIGGGTSYQNTNFDHTRQVGFTITPSIQTASGSNNPPPGLLVHGPPPPQILTQEQPPANVPAAPFHVPTFQQGPSGASAPSAPGIIFTGPAAPFPSAAGQRLPPIGFTGPQQPNTFLHAPSFHPPAPQPIRQFTSPGTLRQLPPSAEGLQPPPLPAQPVQHPYRFEFFSPSVTNGLLNVNIQPAEVPTTQAPWSPSAPPAESGPALIEAANPQPQNSLLEGEASGLRNHWHHREINHQFQESKLVASEVPSEAPAQVQTTTEKPVTHILASDLRKLLLRDQEKQQQQALNSLQNNIDSWTAQEFSNPDANNIVDDTIKQTSTTAVAATSAKAIPNDYFPTSPSYFQPTLRPSYYEPEASGSISHNVHAKVFSKGAIIKAARTRPTTEASTTTTTEEATTTDFTTDYPTTTPEPKRTTTWDRLTVGFSKSSNEKVYVVTPMSTHEWTAGTTTTPKIPTASTEKPTKGYFVKSKTATKYYETTPPTEDPAFNASAFRSPRFTVRPTIASVAKIVDVRTASPISRGNRYYTVTTPDSFDTTTANPVTVERRSSNVPFDLTTVPTYTPPSGQSVQTSAGHSKVVTVVSSESSSSSVKKATRLSIKPVKVEKEKSSPLKQESKEDEEEVVAAVREVSAIELRRKAAAIAAA
ncbi:mucin-2 isoform X2 [Cloeon dipterum]|uniref:mucin-2 isoform X2 n=1 Tax=Cloeon dipterum TaxID=197152 RepID=UPI00321F8D8C